MGRALAAAFAAEAREVTVWNRTPGKAAGLAVTVAGSPGAAVAAADVVVACLIDNEVVRRTLDEVPFGARQALVNLTSGTPGQAREMAAWAAERGIAYLDGAILTPTPMIGTPAGTVLLSGDPSVYAQVASTLAVLGGRVLHLGDDPGTAGAYDMALLDIFATATNGLLHGFALAAAEGIAPTSFAAFAGGIGALLPEMAVRMGAQIEAGSFPGDRSTIASAASSIGHVAATARAHGLDTGMLDAARGVIDRAVAAGHGAEGLARLATLWADPVDEAV
ncbi:NAD(P)-binding domain-containing protein [Catenulispora yoronensis]|uniref:NAD(P)-binding domain-containing protein n=2 Tax=Catenulispora yoronensis TaxID=450799 RepID=A0ABP5GGW6_9ACTN